MTPHESEHQSKGEFSESTVPATINTSESESSKGLNSHPDNHQQPFRTGEFVDYMIQHPKVKDAWSAYTQHEFVKKLGAGTLDVEVFKFYLIQDYIFLVKLARANEIASQKSPDPQIVAEGARIVADFYEEMKLHIDYCAGFGITKEEMESAVPSASCTAYTSYVTDIATSRDFHTLQVSMSPCAEGYKRIARQLYDDPQTKREGNIYWKWIENYADNHYVDSVATLRGIVERGVEGMGSAQIDGLVDIFAQATKLEAGFWQGALTGVKSVVE